MTPLFSLTCIFLIFLPKISCLGSMSSIAVSYGENGPVFCGISVDSTPSSAVTCYGADASVVYAAPSHLPFAGLSAGDGFVCGLRSDSHQPYCWGDNPFVPIGAPQPLSAGAEYSDLSAGDHHLCALRRDSLAVDCWGYNMTLTREFGDSVGSLTAGSDFNCALFGPNGSAVCWGDETGSEVISSVPGGVSFKSIAAGGFHVCGVDRSGVVHCWGRSLAVGETNVDSLGDGDVELAPKEHMISVVGGRFHSCGVRADNREVVCWGFRLSSGVPPPDHVRVYEIAAGDYFTCAVLAEESLRPLCWGTGFPTSIPMAVSPGVCISNPCGPGFFEFSRRDVEGRLCRSPDSRVCLRCSDGCPDGTYKVAGCSSSSDRSCVFDCTKCTSSECISHCKSLDKSKRLGAIQIHVFVAELVFAVVLVGSVVFVVFLCLRSRFRKCRNCDLKESRNGTVSLSFRKEPSKVQPDFEDLKLQRARQFSYVELERATKGFKEESQVGKGSFSRVFKGVLRDGTVVAVKRPILPSNVRNSKEFHTELDLLSRLNHAHLLNLLGYCEERGERLLVYEFMAHGSLHQHLHGKNPKLKEQLDWVKRVRIAVQAARGIEYLHGYACPPVIHRDIKSSNILIDEEHNARVSDFGLSLLGPADGSSAISEPPAGTFGYLDPEYYRLHYLTTKSDVYSFGVLLLEILSGRKAIDMQFDEGNNIVEWGVPLIKSRDILSILDPCLKVPPNVEVLRRIANVASKCVRMRGKERPSMDQVTTALERALVELMGSPSADQPILPTEVVLGSRRLHKKSSQRSSTCTYSEIDATESEDQRFEFRAPSWITFPSVTSSQRRRSSMSDGEGDAVMVDGLSCLEEEIGPASPQEDLFLQHNF